MDYTEKRHFERVRPIGAPGFGGSAEEGAGSLPNGDMQSFMIESVFTDRFETLLLLAKTFAECAEVGRRMRIIVDYDPQAKKTVITYLGPKGTRCRGEG